MITRRQFTFTAAASAMLTVLPGGALQAAEAATALPRVQIEGPVRLIVPFAKNGPTDQVAQLLAKPLSEVLGQAVAVDFITGDWGMTAAKLASIAPPTGTTLIVGQIATHAALPVLTKRYDALADFTPIGLVGISPMVVLVRRDLPFNNLYTLQAYLRANPNRLSLLQGGLGTASALAAVKLKQALGAPDLREVVYTGTASALDDLIRGKGDILIDQMITALPAIRAGQVKAIAIASSSRNLVLPDVYTGAQQGFAGFRMSNWHALFAPKGMKPAMQAHLAHALNRVLESPRVASAMRERGLHVPFVEQRGPLALAVLQAKEMRDVEQLLLPGDARPTV